MRKLDVVTMMPSVTSIKTPKLRISATTATSDMTWLLRQMIQTREVVKTLARAMKHLMNDIFNAIACAVIPHMNGTSDSSTARAEAIAAIEQVAESWVYSEHCTILFTNSGPLFAEYFQIIINSRATSVHYSYCC